MSAVIDLTQKLAERRRRGLPDLEWEDDAPAVMPPAVCAAEAPPAADLRWVVDGLLPAAEPGMLAGDDGSFKTTLVLAIAAAKAGGYPVFGRFSSHPGPVLIVSEEDGEAVLLNRVHALIRGHRWDPARVLPNLHVAALRGVTLSEPDTQRYLRAEVVRVRADLALLDPMADMLGGNEDSATESRPAVRFLRQLADDGPAVVVVHHLNKPRDGVRLKDRVRGSTALRAAMRSVWLAEAAASGSDVRITCVKQSRAAKPAPFSVVVTIEADPSNPAVWRSARLDYQGQIITTLDRVDAWVLATIREAGDGLSTSDLKRATRGTGIRPMDVTAALGRLREAGQIGFTLGPRNSHLWTVTPLQPDLAYARSE
ncbi:MAG: AAA family ATPase [Gemmatimonadales bacterium]